MYKRYFMA